MNFLNTLFEWLRSHSLILWALSLVSLLTFVITAAALPFFVARIPADYFLRSKRRYRRHRPSSARRILFLTAKNLTGIVFVVTGILMLFMPGQGVLTILIGIMLMSLPGKHRFLLRLIRKPSVLGAINWMRSLSERPPLVLPDPDLLKQG